MLRYVCFSLCIFMFLFLRLGEAAMLTSDRSSRHFCLGITKHWFKNCKEIQEEQHTHFLHHVITAIKQPEIWSNPSHLLHILLQFEQFPEKSSLCHHLLISIILNRITFLTMDTSLEVG